MDTILSQLLTISLPPQITIHDGVQTVNSGLTWADVFGHIKSQHWHRTDACNCPHKESLYDHLVMCAKICQERAPEGLKTKAYLAGLLHDIGKPGSRRLLSKHIAFKGHGIVGDAMLENFYSPELLSSFGLDDEDWADICTCAAVHMCTYFPGQSTPMHDFSIRLLPPSVRELLVILRAGDQLALVPYDADLVSSTQEYIEAGERDYRRRILGKKDADFNEQYAPLCLNKGVLIILQGSSANGKTTMSRRLMELFGRERTMQVIHVNRDWYMVYWTLLQEGKPCPVPYGMAVDPTLYQQCYRKYIASGKAWAPNINDNMKRDIGDGLQQGKIVILDTLATMFDSIETIMPTVAEQAYRISIWMHRNTPITECESTSRLGMTLQEQLAAHGNVDMFNPFNKKINWTKMISCTEEKMDVSKHYMRPHLSFAIGWTGIKDSLLLHIVDEVNNIYAYNQRLPRVPVLEQTMDMDLQELVQCLHNLGAIKEFFTQYGYTVSTQVEGTVGIKYIDGINQIWKPRWAREARGRFYYVGQPGGKVIPLKDSLRRGIEVLTKTHTDRGIKETQDMACTPASWERLDPVQRDIMQTFISKDRPIDAYLSGKVDGSLLIINIYPKTCPQYDIILGLIPQDGFADVLAQYCVEREGPLITVSTQGTLFANADMQDYFITAIGNDVSPTSWPLIVPQFVSRVMEYYNSIPASQVSPNHMLNMCFEAYCKDRTTLGGQVHTELAVSYDHSGFNLLGAMTQGRYIPHFDLPRKIFKQPFYARVKNVADVYRLMDELDDIVLGRRTEEEFLGNFHLDEFTSRAIHPEGFVMLTPTSACYDYSKIKTSLYYACHKVKTENIRELLLLPQTSSRYYPTLQRLHSFFDNLLERMVQFVVAAHTALTSEIVTTSALYLKQNVKAQARMQSVIAAGVASADAKSRDIVYKMLLNTVGADDSLQDIFMPVAIAIYNTTNPDICSFTRGLLMRVMPWNDGWQARLQTIISTHDDSITRLYGILS